MANDFRARLRKGDTLLGTMVTLPSPPAAEVLASLGFDWLFVDAEHGPLETAELLGILTAVNDRAACIVRVPSCDAVQIAKVLDLGADGIIVPQVNTAEQAADAVRFARYPPEGARGVGLARAHGYGLKFREYVESANREIAVIVQAEHATAVENIDAIARVPGVDAVLARAVRPFGEPRQDGADRRSGRRRGDPARDGRVSRASECRSDISASTRPRCGPTSSAATRSSLPGSIRRCSPAPRERC